MIYSRLPCASVLFLTNFAIRSSLAFSSLATSTCTGRSMSSFLSATRFAFGDALSADQADSTMIIGKKKVLQSIDFEAKLGLSIEQETLTAMLDSIGGMGSASTFVKTHNLLLSVLPETVSRNNHPLSVHTVTAAVAKLPKGSSRLVFCAEDIESHSGPLASAAAKAFPIYSQKTSDDGPKERAIHVSFWNENGETASLSNNESLQAVCEGVQLAGRLVDMPPEELTTTVYAEECRKVAEDLGVSYTEIVGEELNERGYGGLYGVGKAADCPPRLVILEYVPDSETTETVALVGKGIVYDTGGLSLKSKTGMPGMKHDMGGSAGMLGGFLSAVKLKVNKRLVLVLCLAENAIGPKAVRNDDILHMYSGKTVEVNNADAEGRLVLGDGVAHATKHIDGLNLVVDMATLTGAQLVATGKKHAGILANTEELEQRAKRAGLRSGDLVFPLVYAPELLKKEFDSKVADMKNSVKDRGNAQSSCAGHFIESHLDGGYTGGWLHVDMAGPASNDDRGTGYGVGFLLSLLEAPGF